MTKEINEKVPQFVLQRGNVVVIRNKSNNGKKLNI